VTPGIQVLAWPKLGDVISGQTKVPTTEQWHVRFYGGGSVDLRAAVELLKSVFGVGSSGDSGSSAGNTGDSDSEGKRSDRVHASDTDYQGITGGTE
jgi:hypothetical protein